jgi:intergrase/recombinase
MTALANLSKFQGRYDKFLQIRQCYNLKWSKGDSMQHFQRFFNEGLDYNAMLQRIKEMIRLLPPFMSNITKFACLIGLRSSEVVESVKLLNFGGAPRQAYYNPERQALEHFRFPEIFLRQTKKAYISFVTPEMLKTLSLSEERVPSYNQIRLACWRHGIKMDMRYCRKIFASHLRASGIQPEIIDMLQGRVSQSILTRHYLVPQSSLKDDVLNALEKLQRQLE